MSRWTQLARRIKREISRDRIALVSAGVAFYAFLALFPALAAVISIWGLVADPMEIERQIDSLRGALPGPARELIADAATRIAERSSSGLKLSTAISIALALWSANKGMKGLIEGVSIAYGDEESRGFASSNALSLGLTLGATALALLAIGLVVGLPIALSAIGLSRVAELTLEVFRWPMLALSVLLALAVAYRVSPIQHKPRWRWVTPGSIVSAILWLVASIGFAVYADNFGNYDKVYGSVAAIAMLLVWFFISSYVVLLGAEINAEVEQRHARTLH